MTDAENMMDLFKGSDLAHGRSDLTKEVSAKGKHGTKSWLEKRPVRLDDWEAHLRGERGLGIPPISSDNKVRWGAIDVDVYNGNIEALNARIQKSKLPLVMCRSKSGGPHIYLFLTDWVPAKLMIEKLDSIAGYLGFGTSEIFPKQAAISNDGKNSDFGSWINMPYFGGTKYLRYALDEKNQALADLPAFFTYVRQRQITPEQLAQLDTPKDREDLLPEGPPCLNTILANGAVDFRNITLSNIAVYCKKAFGEDWQKELDRINHLFPTPLPSQEVEAIKKSYAKKDYRYQCSQQPLCNFCEKTKCARTRHGVGQGNFLPGHRSLGKLATDPVIWFLDLEDSRDQTKRISLTTEQLQNPMLFQRRVMETINEMPELMSRKDWAEFVAGLMRHVQVIEVPLEMTPAGQFLELVMDFLNSRSSMESMEDILRGLPFKNTEAYYFRLKDLWRHLRQQQFNTLAQHQLVSILKQHLKAEKCFKVLAGRGTNLLTIPAGIEPNREAFALPDQKQPY